MSGKGGEPKEPTWNRGQSGFRLSAKDLDEHRLNPKDGVLEYRLVMPGATLFRYVPVIPAVPFRLSDKPISWREWLFEQCHAGLVNAHRPEDQTYHLLRRIGYWPTQAKDTSRWCAECVVCLKFRSTRLATGPMKSVLGDEENRKCPSFSAEFHTSPLFSMNFCWSSFCDICCCSNRNC